MDAGTPPMLGVLCGHVEAKFVDEIVIDQEIEGDGVGPAGQLIGRDHFGPNAGVVELQLVPGDDPGAAGEHQAAVHWKQSQRPIARRRPGIRVARLADRRDVVLVK